MLMYIAINLKFMVFFWVLQLGKCTQAQVQKYVMQSVSNKNWHHPNQMLTEIRSKSLWWWYINTNMFLDIIHHPVLFKTPSGFYLKHVSETGFWLCLLVKLLRWAQLIQLIPISGHLPQHQIEYINQAQHKWSVRVTTKH
jgi:hypothetical protein